MRLIRVYKVDSQNQRLAAKIGIVMLFFVGNYAMARSTSIPAYSVSPAMTWSFLERVPVATWNKQKRGRTLLHRLLAKTWKGIARLARTNQALTIIGQLLLGILLILAASWLGYLIFSIACSLLYAGEAPLALWVLVVGEGALIAGIIIAIRSF